MAYVRRLTIRRWQMIMMMMNMFPVTQNTTYLHVLNASIDELDVSQAIFRRLSSMAFTDGNIDKIVGKDQMENKL